MIKGVHRQMIEVTHTGSPYFERAFLVVRSGGEAVPQEKLQRLAQKVVEQANTYGGMRRWRWLYRLRQGLLALGCAGAGALIMWGIHMLMP